MRARICQDAMPIIFYEEKGTWRLLSSLCQVFAVRFQFVLNVAAKCAPFDMTLRQQEVGSVLVTPGVPYPAA